MRGGWGYSGHSRAEGASDFKRNQGRFFAVSISKRVRDSAIEVLIATVLVSAFVAYLLTAPKGTATDWRPIGVVINTLVVFGFLISWFRGTSKNIRFWAILAILLFGHVVAYIILFRHLQQLPASNYAVFDILELGLFSFVLSKLVTAGDR
jgi:hypothetical protein